MFIRCHSLPLRVLFVSGLFAAIASITVAAGPNSASPDSSASAKTAVAQEYGRLPLSFEANRGQVAPQVRFLSRGNGYSLFLTDREAVLSLSKPATGSTRARLGNRKNDIVRMKLAGAGSSMRVEGADQLPGKANYFLGNDPAKWRTNVPTYGKVQYAGVYPGIDLVYYGNQRQLEYDFAVAPGADPSKIRLEFAGAKKLSLNAAGDLQIATANGEIAFRKPGIYQEMDGRRQPVQGQFKLLAGNTVAFTLGQYDRAKPLVIDPVLVYSTYLGGGGENGDFIYGVAIDSAGHAYVTGFTGSSDFPVSKSPYQPKGLDNAFITEFNLTGSAEIYSTYLGGNYFDQGNAIAVDSQGNAYVTGSTKSSDFPITPGAFQSKNHQKLLVGNAFVTKLSPTGSTLVYSTYLGGTGTANGGDSGKSIAIDASGNAYVTGYALSTDFPVQGAYQSSNHGSNNFGPNAFVTKVDSSGAALLYSTYLGGSGNKSVLDTGDIAYGIAIDSLGDAFVAGATSSPDFPTTKGSLQPVQPTSVNHAFVTKLAPSGKTLLYSTYLGGAGNPGLYNLGDSASAIALDAAGDAFVTGTTYSCSFPVTPGAFEGINIFSTDCPSYGGFNGFASKLNPAGSGLVYSTYLDVYSGSGISVDSLGDAFVTGATQGDLPVTSGAFQPTYGGEGENAFVMKLSPAGNALLYSTYLGGSNYYGDHGTSIAVDHSGNVYVAGVAYSNNFPVTVGAFQGRNNAALNGASNGFLSKLSLGGSTAVPSATAVASSANMVLVGTSVTFTATVSSPFETLTPAGSVSFNLDGKVVSTQALTAAKSTYTTTTLAAGTHTMVASYAGSAPILASKSAIFTETITKPVAMPPIFSPAVGNYLKVVDVSLTGSTPGAVIHYTTNNTVPTASSAIYKTPIPLSLPTTIQAIVIAPGYIDSAVASGTYNVTLPAATPVFSPLPGAFKTAQIVKITDATPGATILYTTNGFTPNRNSTQYTAPISVTATETIQAIAEAPEHTQSAVASGLFTIETPAPAPTFSPAAGSYPAKLGVTLTDTAAGAKIYYTTNGTTPTTASTLYTAPISLPASATIKAIAIGTLTLPSPVASANYTITGAPKYSDGVISTAGGKPKNPGTSGNGGPFSAAQLNSPQALAFDNKGNLYIAEIFNQDIRKVDAVTHKISTVAGKCVIVQNACQANYGGDNGPASAALLSYPQGIALDAQGNLYISDSGNARVRMVAAATGIITTVAGNGTAGNIGDHGKATSAELDDPTGLAVDSLGNLYISNTGYSVVRKVVLSTGIIATVAGTGAAGYGGDGGPASKAKLAYNAALAVDSSSNLYIVDGGNNLVRELNIKTGLISTVAGFCENPSTGACGNGYSGDAGKAIAAQLDNPNGIAFDSAGNLYIADLYNQVIRQVNLKTGIITTAAGNGFWSGPTKNQYFVGGFSGDGGPASGAEFNDPAGLAVDGSGNLFIGDYGNAVVRKVTPAAN